MPARIRELFQPNRTSNFAKVNKVNSSNTSPVVHRKTASSSSLDASAENYSSAVDSVMETSSSEPERVFSLLQNSFSQRQFSSLEDYIEASLMLQYNRLALLNLYENNGVNS